MLKKVCQANKPWKQVGIAILMTNKIDFKLKLTIYKETSCSSNEKFTKMAILHTNTCEPKFVKKTDGWTNRLSDRLKKKNTTAQVTY